MNHHNVPHSAAAPAVYAYAALGLVVAVVAAVSAVAWVVFS